MIRHTAQSGRAYTIKENGALFDLVERDTGRVIVTMDLSCVDVMPDPDDLARVSADFIVKVAKK